MPVGNRRAIGTVSEVREADHGLFRNTQHLGENALRGVHGLQRLRDDHMVERLILEPGKATLDVHLDHVDTVADTTENAFVIDFDAVARDVPRLVQVAQEATVTATKIENTLAGWNPAGDHGEIKTLSLLGPGSPFMLGHTAMFSR